MSRLARLVVVMSLVLVGLPSPAHAVECDAAELTDTAGATYGFSRSAEVSVTNRDAFGFSGAMYFDYEFDLFYPDAAPDGCTTEDGGQEIVFPEQPFGDVQVRTKVFTPDTGEAFVRQLWIFENTGASPASLTSYRYFESDYQPREIVTTSSGDDVGNEGDDWLTFNNGADGSDPTVAIVWQGSAAALPVTANQVYQDCCETPGTFEDIEDTSSTETMSTREVLLIPPGETQVLMHVFLLRPSAVDAASAASTFAALPDVLIAGMSDAEVGGLQNFSGNDADADGIDNTADNCVRASNADQANTDGDAEGDACDGDDDGDGLSDDAEIAFGTNPLSGDSDGDGVGDPADACPRTAGAGADGCLVVQPLQPGAPPVINQIVGRVDPGSSAATLTPARDRRLPYRFTARGSVLPPDGLSAQQACANPGFVSVRVRRGRRTIATRRARLKPDCTFEVVVTFRNRRRTGRGTRTLSFAVRWLGNRFLEPVTIDTVTRRVG